ncbi:hypothetical protein BV25DRAFT_1869199 [Artomyces pyxidatus]|uniref:Uncharacterized protein n=1 Tax=Artomyces pyxidatus TaxID=48021 RepID=A0ACB8T8N1_9AGAM|nr:hypothetical protein BV25DRAFT_1869199 [Artomyces pyxidatus]
MSETLFLNSYYIADSFACILYGVELVLYAMTMQKLLLHRARRTGQDRFFIFFSTVNLLLVTISVATQVVFGEEMWIVNADYPGGASAYFQQYISVWYQTMGSVASVALGSFADGLLMYRCFVVWSNMWVLIVPGTLYVSSVALGIVVLWASGAPHSDFFVGVAVKIQLSYSGTGIAFTILATSIITGRILWFAHSTKKAFGSEISHTYYGVIAIVVESMLPYTLSSLATLITIGINSETSIIFLSISGLLACISPQMLVLRVAQDRALRRDHLTGEMTSIAFASHTPPSASQQVKSTGPRGATSEGGVIEVDLEMARQGDRSVDDVEKFANSSDRELSLDS